MDNSKLYCRKIFRVIMLFMAMAATLVSTGLYLGGDWLLKQVGTGNQENISQLIKYLKTGLTDFHLWILPVLLAGFGILGCFLWFFLRISFLNVFKTIENRHESKKARSRSVDHKLEQDRKRRLFLYSLSMLQREGRLLDFMDEDLNLYNDEQIGAAVRSIQEDCKKTIKRYIGLKPIFDLEEGARVEIEAGFDMDSVKLVGNVVGKPPFKGFLRHRGWKAGKKEIPRLSDIHDSSVIVPAEVEIK